MENEAEKPTKKRLTKSQKMLSDLRAYRGKLIETQKKTSEMLRETEQGITALSAIVEIEAA